MAAGGTDGSLKFDTKINTDGFEEGTGSLLKAACAFFESVGIYLRVKL